MLYFTKTNQYDLISYLNLEIDAISNKVRDLGVKDYFDALIYATAKVYHAILITEDGFLHEISSQKAIKNTVIDWKQFLNTYLVS
ncbi:MAG TPA: hypothetical protein VMV49_05980 [Candidatus Deferrimicrobium sp.]|nr:hypothetical protein [Candidatus Deferrimicrobium sp.]